MTSLVKATDDAIAAENKRYLGLPADERERMIEEHRNATWGVLILRWLMPVQWDERIAAKLAEYRKREDS
jgi:hypothetical protein